MMVLRRFRPKRALDTLLWVVVLGFVGYKVWPQFAAALGVGGAGITAPDFHVETLAGDSLALADLRGQVVLVNFWATWCPPCRAEMPGFQRVYDAKKDRGFTIVGLSTDVGGRGVVDTFLAERGISYPVAMASAQAVHSFGGANMLPTSFLIDREGRIRHTVKGIFAEPALRQAVERLLAESTAEPTGEPIVEPVAEPRGAEVSR